MPKYINGYIQTAGLLSALTLLFMLVGLLLGGESGMVIALVLAVIISATIYWNADKIVLRMHGAKKTDQDSKPELFEIISRLVANAGILMPAVYIIDEIQPNAFATGRNPKTASVVISTGLLHLLNQDELSGVIGHELAHIKNHDTFVMSVTAIIASMLPFAPLSAIIVKMAISNEREYEADRVGAEIIEEPSWLASALGKLEKNALATDKEDIKINFATAHMFIINPLMAHKPGSLFSTHPASINRMMRLVSMSAKNDWLNSHGANDSSGSADSIGRRSSIPDSKN